MQRIGRKAPEGIELDAYVRGEAEPRRLGLEELRGRWVVLFYYPRDFTFVCPTEIQRFAELEGDFRQEGAVVVGASTDSYFSHKAWFETDERLSEVTYPVLADTAHRLADALGILADDGTAYRGTFIVDPEGIVRHMLVNDMDVGRNVDETLRTLRALKTGDLCPVNWNAGEKTLSEELSGSAA